MLKKIITIKNVTKANSSCRLILKDPIIINFPPSAFCLDLDQTVYSSLDFEFCLAMFFAFKLYKKKEQIIAGAKFYNSYAAQNLNRLVDFLNQKLNQSIEAKEFELYLLKIWQDFCESEIARDAFYEKIPREQAFDKFSSNRYKLDKSLQWLIYKLLLNQNSLSILTEEFWQFSNQIKIAHLTPDDVYPGVFDLLSTLNQLNIPIYIVSTDDIFSIRGLLEKTGIINFLDESKIFGRFFGDNYGFLACGPEKIFGSDFLRVKEKAFIRIRDRYDIGLPVVIGDTADMDMLAARKARVIAIGARQPKHSHFYYQGRAIPYKDILSLFLEN